MGKEKVNQMIETAIEKNDFSGVVYLKKGKNLLFEKAFGYANRADKLENSVETRFGIASGCKLFTAIGICQLVDKGWLSLDTKLIECLNIEFPEFNNQITIHQLLTHTAGIPDYFDEEQGSDYEEIWKNRSVSQMRSLLDFLPLFQTKPMEFKPGDRFHYNNAGYILLGLVIEQQTGRSFTEYVEQEIFLKCGMKNSGYFEMDKLPANTALGYMEDQGGKWKTNIYSIPAKGGADGGAFSTAPDMMKLWEALFNLTLLSQETTNMLMTPHVPVKQEVHYGYGLWINKVDDVIVKYHLMGYDPGVSFRSAVYPEQELILVIPSNQESGPAEITKAFEEQIELVK